MENTIIKLVGYALALWIVLGLLFGDIYLILDLLKQPAFLWWHLGAIWGIAFINIVFVFLATLLYGSAKMG